MEALTLRECEILDLIKSGYDNCEIAEIIFVSMHTVKAHISSILRKTETKNRTHLIYVAMKQGLIN